MRGEGVSEMVTVHTDKARRGSFNAFLWVRVWVLGEALCFQGWRGNENWRNWELARVDDRGYWLGDQLGVPQKGWNIWVMWSENSVQTQGSENWEILSDEWWKLSDEKVLTKQGLKFLSHPEVFEFMFVWLSHLCYSFSLFLLFVWRFFSSL